MSASRSRHRLLALLSRLLPPAERDSLVGDLLEERALRALATSTRAAGWWYVRQVAASLPPLLASSMRRAPPLRAIGVALLSYLAVGVAEYAVHSVVSHWWISEAAAYRPMTLASTFPLVVWIGFVAARRRGAAAVLVALMLTAVTLMTVTSSEVLPTAYRVAYFIAGPLAVGMGVVLRARHMTIRPEAT